MSMATYEYKEKTIICLYDGNDQLIGRFNADTEGELLQYWIDKIENN